MKVSKFINLHQLERSRVFSIAAGILAASVLALEAGSVKLEVTPVEPVKLEKRGAMWFADFAQDAYGNLQFTFAGEVPAATLTVRLGEKLDPNGRIERQPPGSVNFRELTLTTEPGKLIYTLKIPSKPAHLKPGAVATPPEIGEVTPFRYAEIEGWPLPLDKSELRQLFVHAPFDDEAASFESADVTLNAIWGLCKHTMKATTAFGLYIDGERERVPY
ncbi:MAG TPA: alpha-L-rhamnosidase, partial [Verrucomicrobiae bacterium]